MNVSEVLMEDSDNDFDGYLDEDDLQPMRRRVSSSHSRTLPCQITNNKVAALWT